MFAFFKKKDTDMWLLAGLGNPGAEHAGNRHNIGFMALDAIAQGHNFSAYRSKYKGEFVEGEIAGQKVALLKPQTYMNNSGTSVAAAAKFYKIPPEKIIVFYDDLDLAPGKVRVKQGGGNAGHNGLRSIDAHLPSTDYRRVRLGIGHPGDKAQVSGYVLSNFSKEDQKWVEVLTSSVADHAHYLVEGRENDFMTRVAEDLKEKV